MIAAPAATKVVSHLPTSRMAAITCICLLSLLSLVADSPAGQHSLEKRQTTVTFPSLTDEYLPRTLDGVSLTTVAMVVLVLIVLDVANTHTLVTTVSGRSRPNTFFPGDWDLSGAAGRIDNIIDIVEAGLNFAGVEEESCRLRTTCEVKRAVVNNPLLDLPSTRSTRTCPTCPSTRPRWTPA